MKNYTGSDIITSYMESKSNVSCRDALCYQDAFFIAEGLYVPSCLYTIVLWMLIDLCPGLSIVRLVQFGPGTELNCFPPD